MFPSVLALCYHSLKTVGRYDWSFPLKHTPRTRTHTHTFTPSCLLPFILTITSLFVAFILSFSASPARACQRHAVAFTAGPPHAQPRVPQESFSPQQISIRPLFMFLYLCHWFFHLFIFFPFSLILSPSFVLSLVLTSLLSPPSLSII